MSGRFRPTDAFVDESIRGQRYLMACVLIEARDLPQVRQAAERLVLTGGRLHFHDESAQRRRELLAAFASLPVSAFVVVCHRRHGVRESAARTLCVGEVVRQLQTAGVSRLVLESRHDDRADQRTIGQVRTAQPPLVYEHRVASDEPLLWIADGLAWAFGAGGVWRELAGPILRPAIELRP